jgi:transposase
MRRVFAGVDWAENNHVACLVEADGEVIARVTVAHDKAGIARLITTLAGAEVAGVGIERSDGPLVTALLAAGLPVFVIAPSQVKHLRSRYGSAGNKDDRFDAFVLADVVRTDQRRLTPLVSDRQDTQTLRALVRARKDLVGHRLAVANQLRAHLLIVLPGVVGLFSELDAMTSRAFIAAFGTQDGVDTLTVEQLQPWLTERHYHVRSATVLLQRLRAAAPGVTGAAGQALSGITQAYLAALNTVMSQIDALEAQIADALAAHPDAVIFTSLPRAGTVRAARLLAEIGDCRGRFPTAASLAGLAGVTASTRQSGHTRIVAFRWAVDKQLRDAVCDFAGDSRKANPWAADLYQQARARGKNHNHATRILARAWLAIIFKCWTTNTPYQPAQHRALQTLLQQQPNPWVDTGHSRRRPVAALPAMVVRWLRFVRATPGPNRRHPPLRRASRPTVWPPHGAGESFRRVRSAKGAAGLGGPQLPSLELCSMRPPQLQVPSARRPADALPNHDLRRPIPSGAASATASGCGTTRPPNRRAANHPAQADHDSIGLWDLTAAEAACREQQRPTAERSCDLGLRWRR